MKRKFKIYSSVHGSINDSLRGSLTSSTRGPAAQTRTFLLQMRENQNLTIMVNFQFESEFLSQKYQNCITESLHNLSK